MSIWKSKNQQILIRNIKRISFGLSVATLFLVILDFGFIEHYTVRAKFYKFYLVVLLIGLLSIGARYVISTNVIPIRVKLFDYAIFVLFVFLAAATLDLPPRMPSLEYINKLDWIYLAVFLYFLRESSALRIDLNRKWISPAQLFIASFLLLIVLGTLLLLLPGATYKEISLLDALFTATSAVCVTGLIVVDTGSYFTQFGQSILLMLIQLGGLGIMTFASYFSYFFSRKSSYENQIMLKDMSNSDKIGEVFNVLKKIIMLTLFVEFIGGILIYFSVEPQNFKSVGEQVFFSIFHTISAFCNAGFSTLQYGLYEAEFRFNYPLQLIIAALLILGGIGFPILFNLFKYITYYVKNKLLKLRNPREAMYLPWIINLNTRLILVTSLILWGTGTLALFFLEYENTLAEHSLLGKIVTAFFGSASPRTAGFNSVDMSALNFSSLMIIILLMWIGASPSSTGGGIKTSTFAVATLNFWSIAKGKNRLEVFKREISDISVRRAFAIVALSLVVIGTSIFLIASFDSKKDLLSIAFECFSAFSTVGLSLGITPELSAPSKVVIIITMFIGRVSMLTILIALLKRVKHLNYNFPKEEINMN